MLVLENINKTYGNRKKPVVGDLTCRFLAGKLTVVTGESGSGKSTLLAIAGGYLFPTSGRVLYGGRDLSGMNDRDLSKIHSSVIGYVPQSPVMFREKTVLENIMEAFGREADAEALSAATKIMETLRIDGLAESRPYELSGGEQKRVCLARAAVKNLPVLIADEPTSGLDRNNARLIISFLKDYAARGAAVIAATHDEEIVMAADENMRL